MLSEYLDKALAHARYEVIEDGTYFGSIPDFPGVWADAATEEACREELREVLEGWALLKIADHEPLPTVDGMTLHVGTPAKTLLMPTLGPIKRQDLIRGLRQLGFSGPYSGGKHQYMTRGTRKLHIPNPHQSDISLPLL